MRDDGTYLARADRSLDDRRVGTLSRRAALCAGGSLALWSAVGGLVTRSGPLRAQPLAGKVPVVDRLAIRVVTDSYFLPFTPNATVARVEVQRFRGTPTEQPPSRTLQNEFGLAWHVESQRDGETRQALLDDHGFATGAIATTSFERVFAPTQMQAGVESGLGCAPERIDEAKRAPATAGYVLDDFAHEIALAYVVRDRGLVVMSSCSHRGVVNAVKQAIAVSGVSKVHAVLGGLHLAPHKDDYVRETVLGLKALEPDVVVPMHCTGEAFHEIAQREMPGRVVRSYTGTRYVFGMSGA